MTQNLIDDVLRVVEEEFREEMEPTSRFFVDVDLGRTAARLGLQDPEGILSGVEAVVPLRRLRGGMRVRVDGRTFVDYAQCDSGLAVPGYVARRAGLRFRPYRALDSMVRMFA
jgi:hypothetical protein